MEYIDKSIEDNFNKAHNVLDGFLARCMEVGYGHTDDLYDKMKSDRNYDDPYAETTYCKLRKQLLQENANRCCYCMRHLQECDTTLEHVIPNKANSEEYEEYGPYYPESVWRKMVFAEEFLNDPKYPVLSYPHTVAYENLIPSCNGRFARISNQSDPHAVDSRPSLCCNNKRGQDKVIPFVFNESMVKEFVYHKNGIVEWPVSHDVQEDERRELLLMHKQTIDSLGLNCQELVAIRRIWSFLSAINMDCSVCDKDRTILFLTEDASMVDDEKAMLQNFWQNNYWKLLEDYRYFNDSSKFVQ